MGREQLQAVAPEMEALRGRGKGGKQLADGAVGKSTEKGDTARARVGRASFALATSSS